MPTTRQNERCTLLRRDKSVASCPYDCSTHAYDAPSPHVLLDMNCPVANSTAKERDTESGIDNFEKRYYGSNLGRLMSPDPVFFQAEMLTDPQRFNQYAYARNNPLVYVDPSGEAIRLSDDPGERQKQLDALCGAVGDQACPYLYANQVDTGNKDENGNKIYEYYVGIYTDGPDGKGAPFESLNPVANSLSSIINDQRIADIRFVGNNTLVPTEGGGRRPVNRDVPGRVGKSDDPRVWFTVYLLDPKYQYKPLEPWRMSDNAPGNIDLGIVAFHEFGHVWASWRGIYYGENNRIADDFENMVRLLRDPAAPTRIKH